MEYISERVQFQSTAMMPTPIERSRTNLYNLFFMLININCEYISRIALHSQWTLSTYIEDYNETVALIDKLLLHLAI